MDAILPRIAADMAYYRHGAERLKKWETQPGAGASLGLERC